MILSVTSKCLKTLTLACPYCYVSTYCHVVAAWVFVSTVLTSLRCDKDKKEIIKLMVFLE